MCSEVRSSVNLPLETKEIANKRQCSSSALQPEEETSGRRQYKNDKNPSETQNEPFSSPTGGRFKIAEEPADIGFNHLDIAQASLRKCNNKTALSTAECETPASFTSKLEARETPQSTRGSSSFSPGDAFWNEAILVADGIANPNDGLSSHVAGNNVKDRGSIHLLKTARDGVTHSVSDFRAGSAVGSLGMHPKKEVSPLPVKHFDFSLEAKNLDKEIPTDANKTKPDVLTTKETPGPISQCNFQCYKLTYSSSKDQVDEILPGVHQKSFKYINSERSVEHLKENIHDVAYNTPNSDYKIVASELKSNCTPASSLMKGCLDLGNWLPLEICHIYYKKGISKLYPWQVTLPPLSYLGQPFELVNRPHP